MFTSDIDPEAWFPLKDMLIEPMANIAQLFYDWDLKKAAWDFGRMSADVRFHGVLKLLVKFPKTNSLVEKAGEYLGSYYRPCTISVPVSDTKYCLVRISPLPGVGQDHRVPHLRLDRALAGDLRLQGREGGDHQVADQFPAGLRIRTALELNLTEIGSRWTVHGSRESLKLSNLARLPSP